MSLSPNEIQYAAHLRWRIENNGFKTLNRQFNTKSRSISNERCFDNLLWILLLAYNIYNLFLLTLDLKRIYAKEKITRLDIMRLLKESIISCYDSFYYNSG